MEEENISFEPPSDAMMVDVNFDFLDPRPEFFLSIRNFIFSLFDHRCPVSNLSDLICNQVEVGTFLIADNGEKPEDSVLGFITLLNLDQTSEALTYISSYINSKGDISILNNHTVGVLICERIINIPVELIPMLHSQLIEDVIWTQQNDHTVAYDFIVSVSRCVSTLQNSGKGRKKRKAVSADGQLFFRLEDEILLKYTEESFTFDSESGRGSGSGVSNRDAINTSDDTASHKLVMILRWNSYLQAVEEIKKVYSQEG